MFKLDADYSQKSRPDEIKLSDTVTREFKKRSIPFNIEDLNTQGYGDCMFVGLDGVYSAEIKKAGEFLGDADHCIKQLKKQIPNANYTYLFIYGEASQSPDGKSYSYDSRSETIIWERHPDAEVNQKVRRRYHNVNWQGQRKILWRFRLEGIEVVETPSLETLAFELANWYECGTTVGTTFSRLIPDKFEVREKDKERADFMLSLMGIQNAGIGEEVADALANKFCSISELVNYLQNDGEIETGHEISFLPLRSSLLPGARKRTIGPAKVAQLRKALGIT